MIELSKERIDEILHKETLKTEDQKTLLRAIYGRYMHLYEDYFSDTDKLNEKKITQLQKYHEETKSLLKYYYMDIPYDVCTALIEFDKQYTDKLLGKDREDFLSGYFNQFKNESRNKNRSEEELKADFAKEKLKNFYEAMDSVFRESFGTDSVTVDKTVNWFKNLFGIGKSDKK